MGRRFRLLAAILTLGFTLLLSGTVLAKSYSIPHVAIAAVLQPDGSLDVTEQRTFRFDGAFTHLWQVIELPERSRLHDLRLSDQQGAFLQSTSQTPHTYSMAQQDSNWRVDWYIQAADTEVTFTLTYSIENAVRVHQDGAELYWNLIGSDWAVGAGLAEVTVQLPMAPVDAWVEGPSTYQQYNGKQITFTRRDLPAEQAMTARVLLPLEAVPQSPLKPDFQTLRSVRAAEGRAIDPVHFGMQASGALVLLGISAWFYGRFVRRTALGRQPAEQRHPLPPAAVAALMGQPATAAFRATLLDLALRGAMNVEAAGEDDWLFTRYPAAMAGHERAALELFFGGADSMYLSEWKVTRGMDSENHRRLKAWYGDVAKQIPAQWRIPYRLGPYLAVAGGAALTFLTFPGPGRWLSGVSSAGLLVLALAQRQYTEEGYRQIAAWKAERKRLKQSYQVEDLPVAAALGLKLASQSDPTHSLAYDIRDYRLDWYYSTCLLIDNSYAAPASDSSSDSGGGGGGDGGGGGGAE